MKWKRRQRTIQGSTNLQDWQPLTNLLVTDPVTLFIDPAATKCSRGPFGRWSLTRGRLGGAQGTCSAAGHQAGCDCSVLC